MGRQTNQTIENASGRNGDGGLTILHLSDTHGRHRELGALPEADVVVHTGDFTMAGTEDEAMDFLRWFAGLPHRHKVFVAGNHDDCLWQATIDGLGGGCHYLCHSGVTIRGVRFYGVPMFVADCMEGRYEAQLRRIPEGTDVLLTHQPPLGRLDVSGGRHYGNAALRERVEQVEPRFHLFGHVHGAGGVLTAGATTFVNSALLDDRYLRLFAPRLLAFGR